MTARSEPSIDDENRTPTVMIFSGSLDELKVVIEGSGHSIKTIEDKVNLIQIRTHEGGICNWYNASTGTLQFQGPPEKKQKFELAVEQFMNLQTGTASRKIFVVHGHDRSAQDQLELILLRLELEPFVLANTAGGGLTIIEALENEIGPGDDRARFGIVLLTPDDRGYAKRDGKKKEQPRARQNVIMEMGMLIAALGRPNVAILQKGELEIPSDAKGIIYIPFETHVRETVPKLTQRLNKAGFKLDSTAVAKASS